MKYVAYLFALSYTCASAQFVSTGGPVGGGVVDNIYADDDWAFVGMSDKAWRTADGGNTWSIISEGFENDNLAPRCFAYLGDALYMGCGNAQRCYKSTDDGDTWVAFTAGLPFVSSSPVFVPEMMLVSGSRLFFAGTNFGVAYLDEGDTAWSFTSITSGYVEAMSLLGTDTVWINMGGITYYSHDNGETFTQLPAEPLTGLGLAATDFIERNGRVIACTNGGGGNTVYVSDDYGTSWTLATTGFALGQKLLVRNGELLGLAHDGIYSSADNGTNWSIAVSTGFNTAKMMDDWGNGEILLGLYNGIFQVSDPATGSYVQQATPAVDLISSCVGNGYLFGITASGVHRWDGSSWAIPIQASTLSSNLTTIEYFDDQLFLCTSSGLFASSDDGQTFTQITTEPFTHFFADGTTWLGVKGSQHTSAISRSTDGGATWQTATLSTAATLGYLSKGFTEIDGEYFLNGIGGYFRSIDGGLNWTFTSEWASGSRFFGFDGALFRERFSYDDVTTEIQKSTDDGLTWSTYQTGINSLFYPYCTGLFEVGGQLATYVTEPGLEGLYTIADANATWTLSPASNGLPASPIVRDVLELGGEVYAVVRNYSVWYTGTPVLAVREEWHPQPSVFPNPSVDGKLWWPAAGGRLVNVVNMAGRVVCQHVAGADGELQLGDLPSGVYMLVEGMQVARCVVP